jgi:hypothetical protein
VRRYRSLKNRKPMARVGRGALDARETQERKDYATVHARSGGQCEVELDAVRCRRARMPGVHHVTKRSQGGRKLSTPDTLMDICREHHDLADNAHAGQRTLIDGQWVRGKLVTVALGVGKFRCWMDVAAKRPERREVPKTTTDRAEAAG